MLNLGLSARLRLTASLHMDFIKALVVREFEKNNREPRVKIPHQSRGRNSKKIC